MPAYLWLESMEPRQSTELRDEQTSTQQLAFECAHGQMGGVVEEALHTVLGGRGGGQRLGVRQLLWKEGPST